MNRLKSVFVKCVVLCAVVSFPVVSLAEDSHKINDSVTVQMGEAVWGVKVTNFSEKPFSETQKGDEIYASFINLSPEKKTQGIDPDNWSFYIIDAAGSSYKAETLSYRRDPGQARWFNKQDVLAGAPFPVRIPITIPKEITPKQILIAADVASPAQVAVEIPGSMVTKSAYIPPAGVGTSLAGTSLTGTSLSGAGGQNASTQQPSAYSLEREAQAGYGVLMGYNTGVSGIYWPDFPLGGQVILAAAGSNAVNVSARLHLKFFATPLGRLSLAPQIGYQFNSAGTVSQSTYGIVCLAEFLMPFPVTVAGGRNVIKTSNTWLSLLAFEKAKAIGIAGEIGLYGSGIRHIDLTPERMTKGFSMAGHIYL